MDPLSSPQSPSTKTALSQTAFPASKQHRNNVTPPKPLEQSETVSISPTGQEINQYTEAMTELPDIRKERIAEIQTAIESGTYSVSSQDLADKLIRELSS